jgi:preprotein translocase subunit SecY
MADPTVLGNVIGFFERIGIYDVVLPFLLTFTLVFAIFEKSKVLGIEKGKEGEYTRKNLNAMAAFVVAFMVVASSKLVETITRISSNVVVLILLGVCYMLMVGTFWVPGKDEEKQPWMGLTGGWKTTFSIIMFIGIVFIFLDAIRNDAGVSWLDQLLNYLGQFWTSTAVAAIILIIFLIVFVAVMVREPKEEGGGKSSK